jgi:hypothetical protein
MSWLLVDPNTRIVLFVDSTFENETHLAAFFRASFGNHRIVWSCDVKRDADGIPFVNDLLVKGSQLARTRFCCYATMDTVVNEYWHEMVMKLAHWHPAAFGYVTGQTAFVRVNRSWLRNGNVRRETLFGDLQQFIDNSHCFQQIGSDYFVWRNDPPTLPWGRLPEFRIGGFFWDQYVTALANVHTRAASMGIKVPVYRIANIRGLEVTDKGRIYHNAHIIDEGDLPRIAQADFPPAGRVIDRFRVIPRLLIQVPECRGVEALPVVHL